MPTVLVLHGTRKCVVDLGKSIALRDYSMLKTLSDTFYLEIWCTYFLFESLLAEFTLFVKIYLARNITGFSLLH